MSKSSINNYIDGQFPNNTSKLITPANARNVTKKLNEEGYNLADNDSDDVNEGIVHLFFTDARTGASVAMILQPSAGGEIDWVYNPTDNTITPIVSIPGGSGGSEIDDPTTISLLIDSTKWNDANGTVGATQGGYWNTTTPPIPAENDYYLEPPTNDGRVRHYISFKKIAGSLKPVRIPYIF
jgi:hypothetical protein